MNFKNWYQPTRPNNVYYLHGWGMWSVAVVLSISHVFKFELTSLYSVLFAVFGLILMYIGQKKGMVKDD